jgi:lysophospholipase L1-like esterase
MNTKKRVYNGLVDPFCHGKKKITRNRSFYEVDAKYLAEVGIHVDDLNDEQLEAILLPLIAPEDYYQDGEISKGQADYLHSQRLIRCGVVGDLYIKAMKLI